MHRAMEVHARQTGKVWSEDIFHHLRIGNVSGTFVVNHEIVAFRVVGIRVRR